MATFEIFIQTSTALDTFKEGKYFEAGYFLGAGGFGSLWNIVAIWDKYVEIWNEQNNTADPAAEGDGAAAGGE